MTRSAFDLEDAILHHLGGVMNIIGEMVSQDGMERKHVVPFIDTNLDSIFRKFEPR